MRRWRCFRQSSSGFTRRRAGPRSRRRSCCGRFFCKPSTRCARNGSLWSSLTTTFCSAGSWAWPWTRPFGTRACSPRTESGFLEGDVAAKFMAAVLAQPRVKRLLSDDHFSVDGTLIEAWASMKSFRPKDGSDEPPGPGRNAERNFHGEKRSNETHKSTTDPEAKLYRKADGQPAKLCYMGHVLMENRNALLVEARLGEASGTA